VEVIHVEDNLHGISILSFRARVNPGDEVVFAIDQIQEDFVTHQLGNVHFDRHGLCSNPRRSKHGIMDILWANAEDNVLIQDAFVAGFIFIGQSYGKRA